MPKDTPIDTTSADGERKPLPMYVSNLEILLHRLGNEAALCAKSPVRAAARQCITYHRAEAHAEVSEDDDKVLEITGDMAATMARRTAQMASRDTLDIATKLALAMLLDPPGEEASGEGAALIASALADAVLLADGSLPDVREVSRMTEADTVLLARYPEDRA
jgi:hypothetical protein